MCTNRVWCPQAVWGHQQKNGPCHLPHIHIWTSPSSAHLTAGADVSDQRGGERQAREKTTHASSVTVLYSCTDNDKSTERTRTQWNNKKTNKHQVQVNTVMAEKKKKNSKWKNEIWSWRKLRLRDKRFQSWSVAVIFFFTLFSIEMGTKKGNIHRAKTDFGTKEDSEESFYENRFSSCDQT